MEFDVHVQIVLKVGRERFEFVNPDCYSQRIEIKRNYTWNVGIWRVLARMVESVKRAFSFILS